MRESKRQQQITKFTTETESIACALFMPRISEAHSVFYPEMYTEEREGERHGGERKQNRFNGMSKEITSIAKDSKEYTPRVAKEGNNRIAIEQNAIKYVEVMKFKETERTAHEYGE